MVKRRLSGEISQVRYSLDPQNRRALQVMYIEDRAGLIDRHIGLGVVYCTKIWDREVKCIKGIFVELGLQLLYTSCAILSKLSTAKFLSTFTRIYSDGSILSLSVIILNMVSLLPVDAGPHSREILYLKVLLTVSF